MKNTSILKIVSIIALYVAATVALTFAVNAVFKHEEPLVYVTKTGSKYHGDGCYYLWSSAIPIGQNEAENRGYTPCSRCGGTPDGTVVVNSYVISFCISALTASALFFVGLMIFQIKKK